MHKTVNNNHGGIASSGDFQLYVDDVPVLQDVSIDGIVANVAYTVTEVQGAVPGYEQVGEVVCKDNDTAQTVTHPVTLDEGQSVTCTITNQDIAPELIIEKDVINDDGGDAADADFQLYVNGETADQDVSLDNIVANKAYNLTEDQLSGYFQVGDVVCVDNDTAQAVTHPVTLDEGQSVTCTITNDDLAPGLTVIKKVINDDGGKAQPSDFQLYVNDETVDQGVALDVDSNTEYTVTEDQLPGYTQVGDVSCVDNETQEAVDHPVVLGEGDSVTCTITNNDNVPALILVKDVINDDAGVAEPGDFQLRLNGLLAGQGVVLVVVANTEYTVTEDQVAGYLQEGDVSCIDNGTQLAVAHPVTLDEGQSVTCNDIPDEILPVVILPFTGVYADDLAYLAIGLTLAGMMFVVAARRREDELDG